MYVLALHTQSIYPLSSPPSLLQHQVFATQLDGAAQLVFLLQVPTESDQPPQQLQGTCLQGFVQQNSKSGRHLSSMQGADQALADSQSVATGNSNTHTSQSLQATLCIERALHLTIPSPVTAATSAAMTSAAAGQGSEGLVAVAFEWGGVVHTTPAVALSHAGSATWQHDVALLVAEAGVSCGRNLEPALLHLQVCSQICVQNTAQCNMLEVLSGHQKWTCVEMECYAAPIMY